MRKLTLNLSLALFSIILSTNLNAQSFDNWELQNPYPTSVSLYDIQFLDENTGWVVGDFGTILKTSNGGDTWQKQNTGTTSWLTKIDVYNEDIAYASGINDIILFTDDGGISWNKLICPYSYQNFSAIEAVSPDTVWFGNSKGEIIGCFNYGETWTKSYDGYNGSITSINSIGSKIIASGTSQPPFVKYSSDFGQSWENKPINDSIGVVNDMVFADDNIAYLISTKHGISAPYRIYKSTDSGETWYNKYLVGFSNTWLKLSFVDANHGWSMTKVNLNRTVDGGETWQNISVPDTYNWHLEGLFFVNQNTGYINGSKGRIGKTSDSGESWSFFNKGYHGDINAICMVNNSTGWALSYDYLLKTDNGGNTWIKDEIDIAGGWDMFFLDEYNGWMLTDGGKKVWRTTEADRSWNHIGNINDTYGQNFCFVDENKGWSCRQSGKVYHSINGGSTWAHYFIADDFFARDLVQYENKVWVVGKNIATGYGEICFSDNGGSTWHSQSTDFDKKYLNSVSCSTDGDLYVSDGIKAYRSNDDGITWEIILYMGNDNYSTSSSSLQAKGSDELKIISRSGILYSSYDKGNTWESSYSGYGPLRTFSFTNENIWIAGESGVIAKIPSLWLGNGEAQKEKSISAFPNPGDSQFNIIAKENAVLFVFAASGQQVLKCKLNKGINAINTKKLQSGLYFYIVKNKAGHVGGKGKWIKK